MEDRPSIADLREQCRLIGEGKLAASDAIQDAAPVLLDIAAAALALAWAEAPVATIAHGDAYRRLATALAKVRR